MKILVAEDDFTIRYVLQKMFNEFGECHPAANGREAVDLFKKAAEEGEAFDLVCLDIMMPELTGQEVLKKIREYEESRGLIRFKDRSKVLMITALNDYDNIKGSFRNFADGYLVKPVKKQVVLDELKKLELL